MLVQAVGPQKGYETDVGEDGIQIDLAGYIGFQLECYLNDLEKEERQGARAHRTRS